MDGDSYHWGNNRSKYHNSTSAGRGKTNKSSTPNTVPSAAMGSISSQQNPKEEALKLKTEIESKVKEAFILFEQQLEINKNLNTELEQYKERRRLSYFDKPQPSPEVERLEKENRQLHFEVTRLQRDYQAIKNERDTIKNERDQLHHENARLSNELTMLKQRKQKSVTVQLFSAVNQKLCQLVESELFAMLSTHLETMGTVLQKEQCVHPQEHHDNVPLIVLCVNASRLGTDVQQALINVTYNSTVAVAILHHKEFHALPSQASGKLLIGPEYKKLGLIVDIAFLTNKGMYPCEMNNRSVERLCQFISSFST